MVIEEINPSLENRQQETVQPRHSSQKKSPPVPLIKKGFLNNPKTQSALYPEGSQEGTGGATGGSYARLMSRCQVVDTNAIPSAPPVVAPTQSSSSRPAGSKPKENHQPVISQAESRELDDLMCGVDDDWNQLLGKKNMAPQVCSSLVLTSTHLLPVG